MTGTVPRPGLPVVRGEFEFEPGADVAAVPA